ncbi:MAG: GNAT family N-acetyltransferase [Clostridia bacterium]|nr:GNAT family N-acetyltransferase [Clostridia bacterium]
MQLVIAKTKEQLASVEALYLVAFPPSERKPFSLIQKKVGEGSMEILSMEENGRFLGLAIMILHGDIALLDYLAVAPECRGGGIGTKTLAALRARYPDRHLLLEIEDPDEPSDNRAERLRRREFYTRNGMTPMPYKIWLFGIKMLVLTDGAAIPFDRYHAIFGDVFSEKAAQNVRLAE